MKQKLWWVHAIVNISLALWTWYLWTWSPGAAIGTMVLLLLNQTDRVIERLDRR